jgi:hypothetical protein
VESGRSYTFHREVGEYDIKILVTNDKDQSWSCVWRNVKFTRSYTWNITSESLKGCTRVD